MASCLTCPDLQTSPEFLDVHRNQAQTNRALIARADASGQSRLAENLRRSKTAWNASSPPWKPSREDGPMTRADNTRYLAQASAAPPRRRYPAGPSRHRAP